MLILVRVPVEQEKEGPLLDCSIPGFRVGDAQLFLRYWVV